jgi:hypothetical protein
MATEKQQVMSNPTSPEEIEYISDDQHMVSNVGKDSEDISTAYWHSYQFVGSLIAIVLVGHSLFLGYVLPVCSLLPTWSTRAFLTMSALGQCIVNH